MTTNNETKWKLVPFPPTDEMISAVCDCHDVDHRDEIAENYLAMLAAAPQPPAQPVSGERAELIRQLRNWAALVVNAGQHETMRLCVQAAALLEADAQRPAMKPLGREHKLRMWHSDSATDNQWDAYEWYMKGIEAGEAAHGIKEQS